jgi:hypothetical protein
MTRLETRLGSVRSVRLCMIMMMDYENTLQCSRLAARIIMFEDLDGDPHHKV